MSALTPGDTQVVSQIAVLNGLAPKMVSTLLAQASVLKLKPGQVLFGQGDSATAFFIVLEGWLKLYRVTPAGDVAVVGLLTKGESFAEAVAFIRSKYPVNAEAASFARVVRIPADHVIGCIRESPDIALAMVASTSTHLHRLVQQVEQLTAQSAMQRVAQFLASLCTQDRGPCTIVLPYDKSLIAARLGLKPESLSRVFARLRGMGIEVHAAKVTIDDVAQLQNLVASERIGPRLISNGSNRNPGAALNG